MTKGHEEDCMAVDMPEKMLTVSNVSRSNGKYFDFYFIILSILNLHFSWFEKDKPVLHIAVIECAR